MSPGAGRTAVLRMRRCGACGEGDNGDDERFCMSCGADMDAEGGASAAPAAPAGSGDGGPAEAPGGGRPATGRLVAGGSAIATVDGSYRLVGRADLRGHTREDPGLISRSHFTAYMVGARHFVNDGATPVQEGPSSRGTWLNGARLEGESEIRPGDKVTVSDVEIEFEV